VAEREARLSYYGPWNCLGLIASKRGAALRLTVRGYFNPWATSHGVLQCDRNELDSL